MSKTSLNFGFLRRQSRSEPPDRLHILGNLLGNKVSWFCDQWILIRFTCFKVSVFQGFWASEFGRVFFLYTEKLQVCIPKVKLVPQSFQIQKKHSYKRVKTNRYVPAKIYFSSFCSFLPPIFDKLSGGYRNGLIDVAEKPKILKRFWQRRSRWG